MLRTPPGYAAPGLKLLLLTLIFSVVAPMALAQSESVTLTVLSYNIHHGEGVDGKVDLQRLADVIKSTDADLVALQEVDDQTERTGKVDQTARLAELTGLHGRFVHQIDYEGGRYGQAILSRFPVSDVTVHWLPGTPDRERRIAGAVSVTIGERKLTFVTTHLHHNNAAFRRDQASQLNKLYADPEQIVILAGDLNATPESEPIEILSQHWKSATDPSPAMATFPAVKPERQLDYILFRPQERLQVISAKVIDEPVASDHRPLLVQFKLQ